MRWATAIGLGRLLQAREVEAGDRLFDQSLVALGVEGAADHPRGRLERELGDLGADLFERAGGLGRDLLARLLEPALPLGLRLFSHPGLHGFARLARLGEDRLGLTARLRDELLVLLQQLLRLVARLVGRLDGVPDRLLPVVDELLDGAERVALEHPERDQEADDRPDHQPRRDRDEWVGGDDQWTSTYARIDPSRP